MFECKSKKNAGRENDVENGDSFLHPGTTVSSFWHSVGEQLFHWIYLIGSSLPCSLHSLCSSWSHLARTEALHTTCLRTVALIAETLDADLASHIICWRYGARQQLDTSFWYHTTHFRSWGKLWMSLCLVFVYATIDA